MLEKPVPSLLPYFITELVLVELGLLKEFRNFLVRGIALLLLPLAVFNVFEEELVGLVINFLCSPLGLGLDILLEGGDPVYFLRHLKYNNGNK